VFERQICAIVVAVVGGVQVEWLKKQAGRMKGRPGDWGERNSATVIERFHVHESWHCTVLLLPILCVPFEGGNVRVGLQQPAGFS